MADQDLVDLHGAYTGQVRDIRASTEQYALEVWASLDDYRDDSIDQLARQVAPAVTVQQRQIGQLTDVYLSQYEAIATGRAVQAAGVPAALLDDLAIRGVSALDVYLRSGPTVWTALANGSSLDQAALLAQQRLQKTVQTDLQLAKTHAARFSGERRGIKYFRRELEGAKSCGLCIVASTQRYRRGDLLPIHPGCDCSVAEVYAGADPGQILEPTDLDGAHQTIRSTFGQMAGDARKISGVGHPTRDELLMYRDVLITHQHGEIGPVLGVAGHKFTSVTDLNL